VVRDSASETLPLSQIGGFVIGTRAAILGGVAPATATASMVVDVTTELAAQLVYVCLGIALLGAWVGTTAVLPSTGFLLAAGVVAVLATGGFFAVQRYGGGWVRVFAGRFLPQALGQTEAVTSELEAIYGVPWRVAASFVVHVLGWIATGTATWIAFRLLGAPVPLSAMIAVESLVYGLRSVAFAVPNAIGVQEAAYAAFAPVLGVGPEVALAVSILKRARDVAIGIPVLLVWQALEGSRAVAAARAEN
jgi:putative membrane protein